MRSLRTRLIALWAMLAASAFVTGFLLLQFYRQSANVQVAQAEAAVVRACRDIEQCFAEANRRRHHSHTFLERQLVCKTEKFL